MNPIGEKYQSALEQALLWIQEMYTPVGIIVGGSVLSGKANRTSDLDIYVIHEQPFRQRVQKFFSNVPCEIFINHPRHIQKYFEAELKVNRPVTAHLLATGTVYMGEDHPIISHIIIEAMKHATLTQPYTHTQWELLTYTLVNLYEDATDIVSSDAITCNYILEKIIHEIIPAVFRENHHTLPRIKQRLHALSVIDPWIGIQLTNYYKQADIVQKLHTVHSILMHLTGKTEFFEWKSEPEEQFD